MRDVQTRVHVGPSAIKVWTTTAAGQELIRAKIPMFPAHPSALTTLLRGIALWAATPMPVVISADSTLASSRVMALFAGAHSPGEEPLLRLILKRTRGRERRPNRGGER